MAKTIWKYLVIADDLFDIEMPKGAKVLTMQVQRNAPCLWALVDPDRPKEKRHFRILGTGNPLPVPSEGLEYIGTFQEGFFVWHLFEEAEDGSGDSARQNHC